MTVPNERLRALRWGRELLEVLAQEHALDPTIREQARSILLAYPQPGQLEKLVTEDALSIPAGAAVALQQACMLFLRLDRDDGCSDALLRNRLVTMRHFPDTADIERWSRPAPGFRLRDWLSLEN
jgi:hypothetical protein